MKIESRPNGFTLPELLIVALLGALLSAFFAPIIFPNRNLPKARRIKCINNLKNIGIAFRIYAADHGDLYPWEPPTNGIPRKRAPVLDDLAKYFLVVTNELTIPEIVACPADKSRPAAANWASFKSANHLSYFLSPDSSQSWPQSFLSGDRNILLDGKPAGPGVARFELNSNVNWDRSIHKDQGNACLGDGSVQQLSGARLREQMRNAGRDTNWVTTFLIP